MNPVPMKRLPAEPQNLPRSRSRRGWASMLKTLFPSDPAKSANPSNIKLAFPRAERNLPGRSYLGGDPFFGTVAHIHVQIGKIEFGKIQAERASMLLDRVLRMDLFIKCSPLVFD